jgi:metallo-beta-lactamase family protein
MTIQIKFCGAAQTVTGSCYALTTPSSRFLIDCGMFQGSKTLKELNYKTFPFAVNDIDFVILTHAHIDHSGLVPRLIKEGFKGKIYATSGTTDLCSFMLPDSGHIQEMEVLTLNRRNQRRGRAKVTPIYTAKEAQKALSFFHPIAYNQWISPASDIRIRFWNAGHILGSASAEIEILNDQAPMRLMFSGDIGSDEELLQQSAQAPSAFDYVFSESTYGTTERRSSSQQTRRAHLADIIKEAQQRGGALLIPAFAVERTQELLSDITALMAEGVLRNIPIFLDSPLAIEVTDIFARHAQELLSTSSFADMIKSNVVHLTPSVEDSRNIEKVHGFHIIISASGMCDAGRIRHHLRHWLWSAKATVLLVGYQAQGTLGRLLRDGVSTVRIFGDEIKVHATIKTMDDYSGHADQGQLLKWISERQPIKHALFLCHGEDDTILKFADYIKARNIAPSIITPSMDDEFELTPEGAHARVSQTKKRLLTTQLGYRDWHNELSKLLIDLNSALETADDDKSRMRLIHKVQESLKSPH